MEEEYLKIIEELEAEKTVLFNENQKLKKQNEELNDFTNSQCAKLLKENEELNSKCKVLAFENELLKKYCMKFNANSMINFASYILYYSQNPNSKMDIPNCVYEAVEDKFAHWIRQKYPEEEKSCNNCVHMLESLQAMKEGKIKSAFCLDCSPTLYDNWEKII